VSNKVFLFQSHDTILFKFNIVSS